jgi:L-asparaginase II
MHQHLKPLVHETRCGVVEVLHTGVIAVAHVDGSVTCHGDGSLIVPMRSTLKPFILGVLLDALLEEETFSNEELALMASSHNGQALHIAVLGRLLDRYGLAFADLECGVHPPFCGDSQVTPAGNNCSGKHALLLIACKVAGWDPVDYIDPGSQIQRLVKDLLERQVFTGGMLAGIDGCSIPNYAVTVAELARAYARYAADMLGKSIARVRRAHLAAPTMVGGDDCLDTHLIRAFGLAAKSGSDGVWAIGVPQRGLGLVAKTMSGSEEAAQVALLECLVRLSVIPAQGDQTLAGFMSRPRKSWSGSTVGEIETCFAQFPPTPRL